MLAVGARLHEQTQQRELEKLHPAGNGGQGQEADDGRSDRPAHAGAHTLPRRPHRGGSWGRKLLGKISRRKEEQDTETERLREQFMLPVTRALEKIADPNAIEAIADLAGHADPLVRCHVVGTFAKAGSPAQIPKLTELAEGDPNSLVREAARLAVDRLAPAQSSLSH